MPINIPILRRAIEEGTADYLRGTTFTTGWMAKHGEEGRSRAAKVQQLLAAFDSSINEANTTDDSSINEANNTEYDLKILALTDALFLMRGGPTLISYICLKLKHSDTLDNPATQELFRQNPSNDFGTIFCAAFVDEIQKVIREMTHQQSDEPVFFRSKRRMVLNNPSVALNIEIFNAYSVIANNQRAQSFTYTYTTSSNCTVL